MRKEQQHTCHLQCIMGNSLCHIIKLGKYSHDLCVHQNDLMKNYVNHMMGGCLNYSVDQLQAHIGTAGIYRNILGLIVIGWAFFFKVGRLGCTQYAGLTDILLGIWQGLLTKTKTKTKKPLFYRDNISNNLLILNTIQTKNIECHTIIYKTAKDDTNWIKSRMLMVKMRF